MGQPARHGRRISGAVIVPAAFGALAAFAIAALGSTLTDTGPWYQALAKPGWTPPDAAFGAIWTVIFALWAASAVTAWRAAPDNRTADALIGAFALNGAFNIGWSLLFFRLHRPDLALVEVFLLWASIAALMWLTARVSRLSALLLIPYFLWVGFAAFLNWEIVRLNPPFA